MSEKILVNLNEAQRAAVLATEGPVMVIAGAGSGKTRALTYRVAYLIEIGVDPFHILALTFTNKAAREMKGRINDLVGPEAQNVWMGTFHSVFARVLRIEGHRLGYPSNYTIYDTDDSKRVIKNLIKENNLDDKIYQPGYILNRISSAKTSLLSAEEYNINPELQEYDSSSGKPMTGKLYTLYQARLRRASAMDFDDLLFNMNILLRDFPDVLYKYQQKFQYILVDEYQDTNYAQYLIVKKLAANNENICVVGDDAQSIYAFRGANIQNILNFKHDYPDHQVFKLEQNYRSTKTIVNAANKIIENNKHQIFKEIWTENEEGQLIQLIRSSTDNEEANLVAQSIFENKMNHQLKHGAFAILYRTNAQSRAHEEALRRLNIPCRIYGGLSFYQRKEIKDLLAYFRLTMNNRDEDALLRIINFPARGIGKTTLEKLVVTADEHKTSIFDLISHPPSDVRFPEATWSKLTAFVTMIRSFQSLVPVKNAFELAKHITGSSGLMKELYDDKTPEGVSRFENLEELLNAIKEFSESPRTNFETGELESNVVRTLDEFMQDVALITDTDKKETGDEERVTLMTVHSAKGLEFPYVYVVGLEENLFPSLQSLNSRADLEEERRLFYVAVTRAQEKLTLSYAENRYRWGTPTICEPSRFISEIPEKYLDFPKKTTKKNSFIQEQNWSASLPGLELPPKKMILQKNFQKISNIPSTQAGNQLNITPSDAEEIQTGMEVFHDRFGKGKVIKVEGVGPNKKATVFFPAIGQKQLILRFAKLRISN
ncbi:MAG: UvrD-helicase domain-containing protein [Bacteroidales bacterium]|jgi:DNA helicase-2/ATP-dependent DNA helicase PcrA|nr:UvrD-helicase domain-containing protein [Bacteroidales bacterium]